VYSEGQKPHLIDGEASLPKQPICVTMTVGERPLTVYSRICFGIHHPIQHNVKPKHIGHVIKSDLARMRGYWKMEIADSGVPSNNMTLISYEYDVETNPHSYHSYHNPHWYHPERSPNCFHPVYNPGGYHPLYNPGDYYPATNPEGHHSVRNPYGYHPYAIRMVIMPRVTCTGTIQLRVPTHGIQL
jgi:hypothetical protein